MPTHTRSSPRRIAAPCCITFAAFLVMTGAAATQPPPPTGAQVKVATPVAAPRPTKSPFRQQRQSTKAENYYVSRWGIDDIKVRSTNAGNLIRFSYRVVNAELAAPLNDKHNTPAMASARARVVLQVPVMEKVGALRQSMAPEAGKEYWMVFSNKGNYVKPGDRVSVQIGSFRADGLMVE